MHTIVVTIIANWVQSVGQILRHNEEILLDHMPRLLALPLTLFFLVLSVDGGSIASRLRLGLGLAPVGWGLGCGSGIELELEVELEVELELELKLAIGFNIATMLHCPLVAGSGADGLLFRAQT